MEAAAREAGMGDWRVLCKDWACGEVHLASGGGIVAWYIWSCGGAIAHLCYAWKCPIYTDNVDIFYFSPPPGPCVNSMALHYYMSSGLGMFVALAQRDKEQSLPTSFRKRMVKKL